MEFGRQEAFATGYEELLEQLNYSFKKDCKALAIEQAVLTKRKTSDGYHDWLYKRLSPGFDKLTQKITNEDDSIFAPTDSPIALFSAAHLYELWPRMSDNERETTWETLRYMSRSLGIAKMLHTRLGAQIADLGAKQGEMAEKLVQGKMTHAEFQMQLVQKLVMDPEMSQRAGAIFESLTQQDVRETFGGAMAGLRPNPRGACAEVVEDANDDVEDAQPAEVDSATLATMDESARMTADFKEMARKERQRAKKIRQKPKSMNVPAFLDKMFDESGMDEEAKEKHRRERMNFFSQPEENKATKEALIQMAEAMQSGKSSVEVAREMIAARPKSKDGKDDAQTAQETEKIAELLAQSMAGF